MPKLTRREQLIGWASVVVLIAVFLPWESFDLTAGTRHLDGWTTGIRGWGGALLLAAAGEYLVVRRLQYRVWAPPFGDSWFAAGLAAAGLALVIYRWATLPTFHDIESSSTYGSSTYGLWLAVAAGVVETVALIDDARTGPKPSP